MSLVLDDAELEEALTAAAEACGLSTEALARTALRDRFLTRRAFVPRDDWERELAEAALPCGVSPPDRALSSEGLYES